MVAFACELITEASTKSRSETATPLPLISTAFELLQGSSIFTRLDLRNTYHLVHIRQWDEWKMAFNTPTGHYEYQVMPFALTNVPAVFQALINDILRDMLYQFVFVYLDDILIFLGSLQEHTKQVQKVFRHLLDNHLYIKPEKCVFHVSEVQFLGFIITSSNIQMEPRKVHAVTNWPTPTNVKEVQRFWGIANFYRKFVQNFSAVAAPLSALTKGKNPEFLWSPEAEEAFKELKRRFTSAPVLTLPDAERPFVVEVDASDVGVGAILSQRGVENKLHPCASLSHRLTPAERNYYMRGSRTVGGQAGGGPANCLFVPSTVRFQVFQWGHSSYLTCHPGAARTLDFLLRKF